MNKNVHTFKDIDTTLLSIGKVIDEEFTISKLSSKAMNRPYSINYHFKQRQGYVQTTKMCLFLFNGIKHYKMDIVNL